MKHPAEWIGDYYRKNALLESDTIDCMVYTLKTFLNELSKLLLYGVLFFVLGYGTQFLLCYVSLVSLRLFAGGIHCKTYWGCFALSLLFIGLCVGIPAVWAINPRILLGAAVVSVIFPLLFSPVTPTFRIIKREEQKKLLKFLAAVLTVCWIACAWFLVDSGSHKACLLLTVSVANYQLPVPLVHNAVRSRRVRSTLQ